MASHWGGRPSSISNAEQFSTMEEITRRSQSTTRGEERVSGPAHPTLSREKSIELYPRFEKPLSSSAGGISLRLLRFRMSEFVPFPFP